MTDFKPTIEAFLTHGLGSGTPPADISDCPICMDPFSELIVVLTPCFHWFCEECLTAHIKSGSKSAHKCPVCRYEMCEAAERTVTYLEAVIAAREAALGLEGFYDAVFVEADSDGEHTSSGDEGSDSNMETDDFREGSEDDSPSDGVVVDAEVGPNAEYEQ